MTDQKRPVLNRKRKPPQPAKANKIETKPPKVVPLPIPKLSRKERLARNEEKRQRRGEAGILLLVQFCPELFSTSNPKPLKVGILDDLITYTTGRGMELSQTLAKDALSVYTKHPGYLAAVAEGTIRYDLHGRPAGEITEREREYSRQKLDKLRGKTEVTGKPDTPAL